MPSAAPLPLLPFLSPLALPLALLLSLAIVVSSLAGGLGCSDQVAAGPRPGCTHAFEHEADESLAVVLGNLLEHQGALAVLADADDAGDSFDRKLSGDDRDGETDGLIDGEGLVVGQEHPAAAE